MKIRGKYREIFSRCRAPNIFKQIWNCVLFLIWFVYYDKWSYSHSIKLFPWLFHWKFPTYSHIYSAIWVHIIIDFFQRFHVLSGSEVLFLMPLLFQIPILMITPTVPISLGTQGSEGQYLFTKTSLTNEAAQCSWKIRSRRPGSSKIIIFKLL